MNQEERFSGKRGLQGCLVTLACMITVPLLISAILTSWLGLISVETERVLILVVWLVAVCLGGYVAARLGKTTGWTNSLVVGLLAAFFVVARLPRGEADKDFLDPFLELLNDPATHWRLLVYLALTIPAAVLGGVLWEKTGGGQPSAKGPPEPTNKPELRRWIERTRKAPAIPARQSNSCNSRRRRRPIRNWCDAPTGMTATSSLQ